MSRPPPNARTLAARAVFAVLSEDVSLEIALERVLSGVPPALRATVRSLSYGAVRGFFRYDAVLAKLLTQKPESVDGAPRALLSVALFELEDERSPAYAVVDAAVESARAMQLHKLTGLINAVLRRYLRERAALDTELARSPIVRHAFPDWMAQLLRADWPVRWTQILAASDRQAPLWLRINAQRGGDDAYLARLQAHNMPARTLSGVPHACALETAVDVDDLPGFAEGQVSVQDLGAQCVAFPLALAPGQRVLDACAAPGGKTALIGEQQPALAALWAVELDATRLRRIESTLQRTGVAARVICADATRPGDWWDGQPFDRILVDAPCSALGVIRRHPDIRLRRRAADIDRFAKTQGELLRAAFGMLVSGGRLVYSTCTLTRRENRDVVRSFLADTGAAELIAVQEWEGWPGWGEGDGYGVQILPGEAGADGFYYAALTKR